MCFNASLPNTLGDSGLLATQKFCEWRQNAGHLTRANIWYPEVFEQKFLIFSLYFLHEIYLASLYVNGFGFSKPNNISALLDSTIVFTRTAEIEIDHIKTLEQHSSNQLYQKQGKSLKPLQKGWTTFAQWMVKILSFYK